MQLPEEFIRYTREMMGETLWARYSMGMEAVPPTSVRVNPWKTDALTIHPLLEPQPVAWSPWGYYLSHRPNFTFDPLLHAGAYYVQDAASMFVDHVIRQYVSRPVTMLDLCAAPGGKSIAAITSLPEGSLLFANEPMPTRAQILSENLQKFGHPDVVVTNSHAGDYARTGLMFDVILTDVPCSGEGMFRKDNGAVEEWSLQNIEKCRRLQREILAEIWPCLRPGGLLLYSTCTLNTREDEENVLWAIEELGARLLPVDTRESWGITPSLSSVLDGPVYRFIPGVTKSEGLFLALLRKDEDATPHTAMPSAIKKMKGKPQKGRMGGGLEMLHDWIDIKETMLAETGNKVFGIPARWAATYEAAARLKVIHAGICMAEHKGNDLVPHSSLALSLALRRGQFAEADVDYATAITYLRKETVTLPPQTLRGYVLLTYKGHPLGFVKNLQNRANNLYPQEWRIRSTHIPDNDNEIMIQS